MPGASLIATRGLAGPSACSLDRRRRSLVPRSHLCDRQYGGAGLRRANRGCQFAGDERNVRGHPAFFDCVSFSGILHFPGKTRTRPRNWVAMAGCGSRFYFFASGYSIGALCDGPEAQTSGTRQLNALVSRLLDLVRRRRSGGWRPGVGVPAITVPNTMVSAIFEWCFFHRQCRLDSRSSRPCCPYAHRHNLWQLASRNSRTGLQRLPARMVGETRRLHVVADAGRDPRTSEPTSDSSVCSTPGDRTSSIILMSITSFPPAAWLSTGRSGSIPRADSSSLSTH